MPDVPSADPDVVFCFALFHDSMRFNEFDDPEHGRRGGELAGVCWRIGLISARPSFAM